MSALDGPPPPYQIRRAPQRQQLQVRGAHIAVTRWGEGRPIVLLHGWMDSGAAWQLLVDQLPEDWSLAAIDWRGYGHSDPRVDHYWMPDHFADLESVLAQLCGEEPACVIGHSMGGTIASVYAGLRPERLRWVINIEGMGVWRSNAPTIDRVAHWLDAQRELTQPKRYASLDDLARRILARHKRLRPDRARFLAEAWTREVGAEYEIAADPKHQLITPLRLRRDEIEESWSRIVCPMLLIHGGESDFLARAGGDSALMRWRELIRSLQVVQVAGAGHMVHHEQPELTAQQVRQFVGDRH